ncbi:hypothetical protein ACEQ8H_002888 [Pleosporales sp. CAS-2024a]
MCNIARHFLERNGAAKMFDISRTLIEQFPTLASQTDKELHAIVETQGYANFTRSPGALAVEQ